MAGPRKYPEDPQVAPSTCYAHKTRPPSARSIRDEATTTLVRRVRADNYGVSEVHAELNRQGHWVARCTMRKLMRGRAAWDHPRQRPRTTIPGIGLDMRPNLVQRQFTATSPDQLWVADKTYCRTFSGRVTPPSSPTSSRAASGAGSCRSRCAPTSGWTPSRWVCGLAAAKVATSLGLTHHSDKGVQYVAVRYTSAWPRPGRRLRGIHRRRRRQRPG